jgi:hypothetical protein
MNIKDFVTTQQDKDMISELVRTSIVGCTEEDYELITDLTYEKLEGIQRYKESITDEEYEKILKSVENTNLSKEQVIDSAIFFSIIVENAMLTHQLSVIFSGTVDEE